MKPKRVTITITDNPDCTSCNVEFAFAPAYHPEEPRTPAVRAFVAAYEGIKGAASGMQATRFEYEKEQPLGPATQP